MTAHQVHWAAKHDWYIGNEKVGDNNYKVIVRDDLDSESTLTFYDFTKLVEWAGY